MIRNWYTEAIRQEAGWKDIAAALAVFLATMPLDQAIAAAAHKLNVPIQQVQEVAQQSKPEIPKSADGLPTTALTEQLKRHEGFRADVYPDPVHGWKVPTVGIGFNLVKPGAKQKIEALGLDYSSLLSNRTRRPALNANQIMELYQSDLADAVAGAKQLIPTYEALPGGAKQVLVNMVFNMGTRKLAEFKNFRAALARQDFNAAANEMANSNWHHQVKGRAVELENLMRSQGKS